MCLYQEDSSEQQLISETEQQVIYRDLMSSQRAKFISGMNNLIDRYMDDRKELMNLFGMNLDGKELRKLFAEIYNSSVKSVTEYFGARKIR
jgi:hypothetical protein